MELEIGTSDRVSRLSDKFVITAKFDGDYGVTAALQLVELAVRGQNPVIAQ